MKASSQRQNGKPLKEIDILWITAGLGCDGESIAMTAATQPSIEDLLQSPRLCRLMCGKARPFRS